MNTYVLELPCVCVCVHVYMHVHACVCVRVACQHVWKPEVNSGIFLYCFQPWFLRQGLSLT